MKKQLLYSWLLAMLFCITGASNAWAQAEAGTTLWSEDFSGYANNVNPSGEITNDHSGTVVYGGFTLTYSRSNGGGTTQTYTSGGPNSNNNLLIAKGNGTFDISGIPTGGATELTVSYAKSGSGVIAISSSTTDVEVSGSVSGSTITTNGAETIQLTFKNTGSSNLRIDDIVVTVKTAGSGGGADNTITAIPDKEVGVLKSITLTPSSDNGTTPFTFSTTSDKISLSTGSGTSCEVTGLAVTGGEDAVVMISQAAGTHNATDYKAATPINVNISVVDNRTTPGITFSTPTSMTSGDEQTITVTTDHTGTRTVSSSNTSIATASINGSGNIEITAGSLGGTATITLNIAENSDYKATSNSFDVTVDDGKINPTITVSSNEVGINATNTFTLTSNSAGALTVTMDDSYEDYALFEDKGAGTFDLAGVAVGPVTINVSQAANGSYRAYETTFNINVVDNRATPSFSFDSSIKNVDWDDRGDYVKPTLTYNSDATPTYTSSNTSVATVNASTGDITFVAGGETTITARVSGSAYYKDAEASYTLIVNKPFEFVETFDNATSLVNGTDNSDWTTTGYTTIAANVGIGETKCARLGSGSNNGGIITPALTDIPNKAVMTFQAVRYGTDTGVTLSISGTNCTVSPTSFNITESYATYTVTITKTGSNPTISLTAPTSGKRAYIDNITITDLPNATISIGNVTVKEGQTENATVTTNNTTGAFTFESSDDAIATVAKVGEEYVVTGVSEGNATITATQAGNDYYKTTITTFNVTVLSATTITPPTFSPVSGTTVEVGANITLSAEEGCTIKYTTDGTDPKVSGTATSTLTNSANVVVPTGVASLTVKAVSKNGENFSELATATYTVEKKTLGASFDQTSIFVAIGADADEPTLTNPSGGTVSWESDDTEVVTVDEFGQLTAVAEGTATITANIATTDTYLAGTATYEVTVYDPTNIVINFNNDPFGIGEGTYAQEASLHYNYLGVGLDFTKGEGGTNPRVDGNHSDKVARVYTSNTMTITAPAGFYISGIEFDFNKGSITNGSTTYSSTTTTWSGAANNVTFVGAATTFINKITVSLTEGAVATISAAKYATFHATKKLNFSATGITVYKAAYNSTSGNVTLTEIADGKIPANTPVVLYKNVDAATTIGVPAYNSDVDAITGNELRISDGTTATAANNVYVLSNKSHGVGFYRWAGASSLSAGKVYIQIPGGGSAREFFGMVEEASETTGIESIDNGQLTIDNEAVYDLQGRKVQNPKRGLYIINGHKVVIK